MTYRLIFLLVAFLPIRAEIVDRIAITVGREVITEGQIGEELRVTAFLNHAPISEDLESRRAAADRIVAQLLVEQEMQLSHYPEPEPDEINRYLQEVRKGLSTEADYQQALTAYQITEPILKKHLVSQLATLSFIELRFHPSLDIPESEIRSFYTQELATWDKDHPNIPPPSFQMARPAIVKTLTEEHTDQILDTWLEEARKQVSIIYLDKALQ